MLVCEVHSYHRAGVAALDVVSASWSSSVSSPWGSLTVGVKPATGVVGHGPVRSDVDVRPGDWIVLRDASRKVLGFGRVCDPIRERVICGPRGSQSRAVVQITAVDPLAYLLRVQLRAEPGIRRGRGTLLGLADYQRLLTTVIGDLKTQRIGEALERFLFLVGNVYLPASLGGDTLGRSLRVVYDEPSAAAYAPTREATIDPVVGFGLNAIERTIALPQGPTTIAGLLTSSFVPDPGLIELFFALEPLGTPGRPYGLPDADPVLEGQQERARAASIGGQPLGDVLGPAFEALDIIRAGTRRQAYSTPKPVFDSPLAAALGANPAIIYRMRPWRPVALEAAAREAPPGFIDRAMFSKVSWRLEGRVADGSITSVASQFGEAGGFNAFTATLPFLGSEIASFLESSGLPLVIDVGRGTAAQTIELSGLRCYSSSWSFARPIGRAGRDMLVQYMRTIAFQAAQFYARGDQFQAGQIACKYDARLEGLAGRAFAFTHPTKGETTAYADAVEHTWAANQKTGAVVRTTVISWSRGLQDERARGDLFGVTA